MWLSRRRFCNVFGADRDIRFPSEQHQYSTSDRALFFVWFRRHIYLTLSMYICAKCYVVLEICCERFFFSWMYFFVASLMYLGSAQVMDWVMIQICIFNVCFNRWWIIFDLFSYYSIGKKIRHEEMIMPVCITDIMLRCWSYNANIWLGKIA